MARFFKPQTQKKIDTKHQEYFVTKLDHLSNGIALSASKTVFIPNALPNEKVLAQLIESKKHYARAKLIKVIEANPARTVPFCSYYKDCGGCNLQHLTHSEQIKQKQQILTELIAKFAKHQPIEQSAAIVSSSTQYRRRARLGIKVNNQGQITLGFRKRASNEIINITHCPVLKKELDAILTTLHSLLNELKNKRFLGHIELSTSHESPVLFIRTVKNIHRDDIQKIKDFAKQQALIVYIKQGDNNVQGLCGSQPYYKIDGLKINYRPQNFLQVNEEINHKMVSQAIDWLEIKKSDQVLDLFCGLGNFSLPIAKYAKSVIGIEGVEAMVEQARHNAKINLLENVEFYHANLASDVSGTNWSELKYQKILLDPARTGAFEIMGYLAHSQAEKILYVSCNPATLARDSQILLENGYKLTKLGLLDMFPNTGHLEAIALFTKI